MFALVTLRGSEPLVWLGGSWKGDHPLDGQRLYKECIPYTKGALSEARTR